MRRYESPFDRGYADFYYYRGYSPHYYAEINYKSKRIEFNDMTVKQIEDYRAGWEDARINGEQKEWSDDV
jgi:hypothetical protein